MNAAIAQRAARPNQRSAVRHDHLHPPCPIRLTLIIRITVSRVHVVDITVVIEDRGLLSMIFLNNNLHVVHHMHPQTAWYDLPKMFAENREHYLKRNDSYYYRSYAQIFRAHFLRTKDPVPHPLWHRD